MDPAGFNILVKNYSCLTEDESSSLKSLAKEYPYSQIISLLQARAARDLNHQDKDVLLNSAAVYSTERSVLKHVMTAPKGVRTEPVVTAIPEAEPAKVSVTAKEEITIEKTEEIKPVAQVVTEAKIETVSSTSAIESITLTGDELREDLMHELEKLKRLKDTFEHQVDEFQHSPYFHPETTKGKQSKEAPPAEPLIEEIKSTRKKLKTDNPKQKEQIEIIDQFIKAQPSIPKPKPVAAASDLAEDSGLFSDNIISETLVEILLKQGKKEKAIEVLKKLIWKFPQKKAYFAAQIDSLKS